MFDSFTKYNINQYYCFNCFFVSLERNVFISLNVWSRRLRKYLKTLANKISGIMWGWEISTWRMEHSNHLPKSHHGCNLRCGNLGCNLAVHTFVKISRGWIFCGYLSQMLQTNDFKYRTFIIQFSCRKMKAFLSV